MPQDQLRAKLWLAITEGLTPRRFEQIRLYFDTPLAFWESFAHFGWPQDKPLQRLLEKARDPELLDSTLEQMAKVGARLIYRDDPAYPPLLRQIVDPPVALFVRGKADLTWDKTFAIVGSRACTRYGVKQAAGIAGELAQAGVLVVSGLARGIDIAAGRACAQAGKPTVAVLGCGVDVTYPPEHEEAIQDILASGGAVISEYRPGTPPIATHFPRRNRIISGMSAGLLVVEAARRSGAMITVRLALEQGREVFALPGPVDTPTSFMPLQLLREGAGIATCGRDILEDMRWSDPGALKPGADPKVYQIPKGLEPEQAAVVKALLRGETPFETLLEETGLSASALNSHLTMLEIQEIIVQLPGRAYAIVGQSAR